MIQRIQSIYLLLSTISISTLYFRPLAEIFAFNQLNVLKVFELKALGLVEIASGKTVLASLPVVILLGIIAALSFISIFLYKKRKLQIRILRINMLLIIGLAVLGYYYFTLISELFNLVLTKYSPPLILPLIALLFIFLAKRAINRDEKLVRSLDRIR